MALTNTAYFDTDCLSAFLWVEREDILLETCKDHIVVPSVVLEELSRVPHLYDRLYLAVNDGLVKIQDIEYGTVEYNDFCKFTTYPDKGFKFIGDGEAAAIALAKNKKGILASNNLRDIADYVRKYQIKLITSADIMVDAYQNGIITESEGNNLWRLIKNKRQKLPGNSLTEYLQR